MTPQGTNSTHETENQNQKDYEEGAESDASEEIEDENEMKSLKGSNANGLEWWDFNVDFHSSTLDINKKEYENIVENNP